MDKLKRQASTVNDKEDEKCGALKNASAKHLRPTFKLRRDTLKTVREICWQVIQRTMKMTNMKTEKICWQVMDNRNLQVIKSRSMA